MATVFYFDCYSSIESDTNIVSLDVYAQCWEMSGANQKTIIKLLYSRTPDAYAAIYIWQTDMKTTLICKTLIILRACGYMRITHQHSQRQDEESMLNT